MPMLSEAVVFHQASGSLDFQFSGDCHTYDDPEGSREGGMDPALVYKDSGSVCDGTNEFFYKDPKTGSWPQSRRRRGQQPIPLA